MKKFKCKRIRDYCIIVDIFWIEEQYLIYFIIILFCSGQNIKFCIKLLITYLVYFLF